MLKISGLVVLSATIVALGGSGGANAGSTVTPSFETAATDLLWLAKTRCVKVQGQRVCFDDDDDDDDEKPKKKPKKKQEDMKTEKSTTKKPQGETKAEPKPCPIWDGMVGTRQNNACCYNHPSFGPLCNIDR